MSRWIKATISSNPFPPSFGQRALSTWSLSPSFDDVGRVVDERAREVETPVDEGRAGPRGPAIPHRRFRSRRSRRAVGGESVALPSRGPRPLDVVEVDDLLVENGAVTDGPADLRGRRTQ